MPGLTPTVSPKGKLSIAMPSAPALRLWPVGGSGQATLRIQRPRPRGAGGTRFVRRSEPFLMMAVACALIALLATLYLTEDNKAALMTYQINEQQNQESLELRTQGDLKLQLEQLEALQRVQTVAAAQGMVPVQPTATTYIELPPAEDTVAPPAARSQP
jgi:hypothetical protein